MANESPVRPARRRRAFQEPRWGRRCLLAGRRERRIARGWLAGRAGWQPVLFLEDQLVVARADQPVDLPGVEDKHLSLSLEQFLRARDAHPRNPPTQGAGILGAFAERRLVRLGVILTVVHDGFPSSNVGTGGAGWLAAMPRTGPCGAGFRAGIPGWDRPTVSVRRWRETPARDAPASFASGPTPILTILRLNVNKESSSMSRFSWRRPWPVHPYGLHAARATRYHSVA